MTMRKIIIRFCKNIESSVLNIERSLMKSINVQGGFLFCAGWNFPKLLSVTSRLLERWEYIQSKVRGRFCKILWPSQNAWTLLRNVKIKNYSNFVAFSENTNKELEQKFYMTTALLCKKIVFSFANKNELSQNDQPV